MTTSQTTNTPDNRLSIDVDYNNLVDAHFYRRVLDENLSVIYGDGWTTSVGPDQAPGTLIAQAHYSRAGRLERLVALDRAVAHLVFYELALHIRIAGVDQQACEVALEQIRLALPADPGSEEEVPVDFWWLNGQGPQNLGRMLPAPKWGEIAGNYAAQTLEGLESLMALRAAPPAGGRLILWHGAPGTGKTTAVRALAREWREWADFQFITDPEYFLQTPAYLLDTIANPHRRPGRKARWRVIVLEDSGEFLAPDAKHMTGQALSRLLNVCDGALGQATRTLVLVTTNEHLRTLHPALSRPGRCLSEVEFHELNAQEIAGWCDALEIECPDASRASLADLFAHADGRAQLEDRGGFGFAAAVL